VSILLDQRAMSIDCACASKHQQTSCCELHIRANTIRLRLPPLSPSASTHGFLFFSFPTTHLPGYLHRLVLSNVTFRLCHNLIAAIQLFDRATLGSRLSPLQLQQPLSIPSRPISLQDELWRCVKTDCKRKGETVCSLC
jgi:hypothetical protein